MPNKNDFTAMCPVCYKKTWYSAGEPCHMSYPHKDTCKTCGHTETDYEKMEKCNGIQVAMDYSQLNPAFHQYYESNERIEVSFRDKNGKEYEKKRGTIGRTTGWKPVYLLMSKITSIGSSDTIGMNDRVIQVIKSKRAA